MKKNSLLNNCIIPIFKIESEKKYISIKEIENCKYKFSGKGFFISKKGFFATCSHVLTKSFNEINDNFKFYGFFNTHFYLLNIIDENENHKDENHNDIAIGKMLIDIDIEYIDIDKFKRVTNNSNLIIVGFSKFNELKFEKTKELLIKIGCKHFEDFVTNCSNSNEYIYEESKSIIKMKNFFTIKLENSDYYGLSGSPIINENKEIVGLFSGGKNLIDDNYQAIHIEKLIELINNSNKINIEEL